MKSIAPLEISGKIGAAIDYRALAEQLHALGFNVLPENGKRPNLPSWDRWQTVRQTLADVARMNWRNATGVGVVCGPVSGGLVQVDFDDDQSGQTTAAFLFNAGLPANYSWVVKTRRGFHVWVLCPGLELGKSTVSRDTASGGHVEIRAAGAQAPLPPSLHPSGVRYAWANGTPGQIVTISPALLLRAYQSVTLAKEQRQAPQTSHAGRGDLTGDLGDKWLEKALARAKGGSRNDTGLWLACQLRDAGLAEPAAEAIAQRYQQAVCNLGEHPYTESEVRASVRQAYRTAPRDPAWQRATEAPTPGRSEITEILNKIAVTPSAYYWPGGAPLELIGLIAGAHGIDWLNGLGPTGKTRRGVAPNGGAAALLLAKWNQALELGLWQPGDPITASQMSEITGVSEDLCAKSLSTGYFAQFFNYADSLTLIIADSCIGSKSPVNSRKAGRPAKAYQARPLCDALDSLLAMLEGYLWPAVWTSPDFERVPLEAQHYHVELEQLGVMPRGPAAVDDHCRALFTEYADQRRAAHKEYSRRRAIYRKKFSYNALTAGDRVQIADLDSIITPTRFCDAFANYLTEIGKSRYEVARLTGRTLHSLQQSCKRRGVVSIPQYAYHRVTDQADVLSQIEATDRAAFERGRVELVAPNGAAIRVTPRRASEFDLDGWLADNDNGEQPAHYRVRKASIEKRESEITAFERAEVERVKNQQSALAHRRQAPMPIKPAAPEGPYTERYLAAQADLRAPALGFTQSDSGQLITPDGEVIQHTAAAMWQALAEAVPTAVSQPFSTEETSEANSPERAESEPILPTFTVYSDPEPAATATPRRKAEKPTPAPVKAPVPESPRPCLVCGKPGHVHYLTGWYCSEEHRAIPASDLIRLVKQRQAAPLLTGLEGVHYE